MLQLQQQTEELLGSLVEKEEGPATLDEGGQS